jgi:GTP-binding protein HflX
VQETLEDLGAGDTSTLIVFNKIDLLQDRNIISALAEKHPNRVFISAARGINIVGLKDEVAKLLEKEFTIEEIVLPNSRQKLIAQLYDIGEVLERAYEDEQVRIKIRIHRRDRERFLQMK